MVGQLNALIEYAQAQGCKVYLVAMPAMPKLIAFLPHGRADYDLFAQTLQSVSQKYAVPLMTFDPTHWVDNFSENNYRDYWHMNDSGAQIFTHLVADWYAQQN
jgi:lysophospholipase L1-like esterase